MENVISCHEIQRLKNQLKDENLEIIDLVTRWEYDPFQSLDERYGIIKKAQEEEIFEIFKRIVTILSDNFGYYVQSGDDNDDDALSFHGNYAYDFEMILNMSRWYKNHLSLLDGHLDIISRSIDLVRHKQSYWLDKLKPFWLSITQN